MKKFDFKKLLVLVLVLAMSITVFAACGPTEEEEDPINKVTETIEDRQNEFFDKMFAAGDEIGKTKVDKDGNISLKLGIGLDLQIGKNANFPAQIDITAFVDRGNLEYIKAADGDFVEVDEKYVRYDAKNEAHKTLDRYKAEPQADNTSAILVTIKADQVVLAELYYDVNDKVTVNEKEIPSGIVYATIGGNKIKVDTSNYEEDITNVVGIVLSKVESLLSSDIFDGIISSFGEKFTVNTMLNNIINNALKEKDQTLAEIIEGTDFVKSMLTQLFKSKGLDINDYLGDELDIKAVLKVLSNSIKAETKEIVSFLFDEPVWDDEAKTSGKILLLGKSEEVALIRGLTEYLKDSEIYLGFTANEGKMEDFYIDAKLKKLGTSKQDLKLKLSINELKIENDSIVPEIEKDSYKDDIYLDTAITLTVPENFVGLFPEGDKVLLPVGNENGVPTKLTIDLKGKLSFVDNAETRVMLNVFENEVKEPIAKAHLYYDETAKSSVAEASVNKKYMDIVNKLYKYFVKSDNSDKFGWYDEGKDLVKFGWYDADGKDLVKGDFSYAGINEALCKFQKSGKLKLKNLKLYDVIFPRDGETWFVNFDPDSAKATAGDKVSYAFKNNLNYTKRATGILAVIVDLISYQDSAKRTDLTIGHNAVMDYLFTDNLFTIDEKNPSTFATNVAEWVLGDQANREAIISKYSILKDENESIKIDGVDKPFKLGEVVTISEFNKINEKFKEENIFFKLKTTQGENGSLILSQKEYNEITQDEAMKYSKFVFEEFNTNYIATKGYTLTNFNLKDIGAADAFVKLFADKTDNIMTNAGIEIDIKYAEQKINLLLEAKLNPNNLTKIDDICPAESFFGEVDDTVGVLELKLYGEDNKLKWPTAA